MYYNKKIREIFEKIMFQNFQTVDKKIIKNNGNIFQYKKTIKLIK